MSFTKPIIIESLRANQLFCFESIDIPIVSPAINIITGRNNAGKSTLLRCFSALLGVGIHWPTSYREGGDPSARTWECGFKTDGLNTAAVYAFSAAGSATAFLHGNNTVSIRQGGTVHNWTPPSQQLPAGFGLLLNSVRKTGFVTDSSLASAAQNTGTFQHLYALVDAALDNDSIAVNVRSRARSILGIDLGMTHVNGGRSAGVRLTNGSFIALSEMGAGVPTILWFLVMLEMFEGKLYFIEEPENDLHPQALKELCEMIRQHATKNQFFITTHSNIVLRELGVEGACIFEVAQQTDNPPTSHVSTVTTYQERLSLLERLGYSPEDFDQPSAYILFEEASCERFVKEFLIPMFVPELSGKIRTIGGRGAGELPALANDLNRMFVYLHLLPVYHEKCWIVADGDEAGVEAVQKVRDKFPSWPERFFRTWKVKDYEYFLPPEFAKTFSDTIACKPKGEQKELKDALGVQSRKWMNENPEEARSLLSDSASEVIKFLEEVRDAIRV